jgi:diguanylate cyclase (GGDEF)-like protein
MEAINLLSSPLIMKSLEKAVGVARAQEMAKSVKEIPAKEAHFEENLNLHGIPQSQMTPEVKSVIDDLMAQIIKLNSEQVKLRSALRRAESLADTDSLSGVFNNRAFLREMGRVMAFGQRYDIPTSLLYFDLNGFKGINDTYGHAAGDAIIKGFSKCLQDNVRESDIVGRVGGDEFAVLLAHANYADAKHKAAQLKNAISALKIIYGDKLLTTNSTIGVYAISKNDTPQSAIKAADNIMYQGKISNRIQIL